MWGYRIIDSSKTIGGAPSLFHDNDDDGEDAAGGKIAQLLQNMMKGYKLANNPSNPEGMLSIRPGGDIIGVLVLISRWYGGTKLGPKRFQVISNEARNVLLEMKFESGGSGEK